MKKLIYAFIIIALGYSALMAEGFEDTETLGVQRNEIQINPQTQEITRIISIGEANYSFDNAKNIRQAITKAELSAKAAISKYLSEDIKTQESQEQLSKILSEQSTGTAENVSQKDVDTLTINTQNSAAAILKGVVTIQTQINKQSKSVRVTLGYNRNAKAKPSKKYEDF